ncbi:hypothetical protein [Luteimonas deserti]|uniref:Uncharacterized protein n=1 Tax=Luteimonas deserti TaxID=2752306 RepID=A0A7Z0QQF9_9GAMM|nr:hypothetical protein [Luteimonas deserti]NYZ62904.1 hypothetical protein [Luteimonas deserti]
MTSKLTSRRVRFWFWVALFCGYSVAVAGVVVDAIGDHVRRMSQVADTTAASPDEARRLGAAQVAALHRAQSATPFRTLPAGETFRVVWPDGSSEMVRIVSTTDAQGAAPVAGTARDAAGLAIGPVELKVEPVSTEAPRRDPSLIAERLGD